MMRSSDNGLFQPVYALAIFVLLLMGNGFGFNPSIAGAGTEASGCIERERQALLAFKHGVIDDSGMLSGWRSEEVKKDCCKWSGVQCSNTTGHVIALHLQYMHLGGNLSSSLFELQHLIYLDLSNSDLNGHIPESIGLLKKLKHLDLSLNKLSGPLPSDKLGNLTSLEFLNLSYGYNFDSVKNLEWLSHLSSLKVLNLSSVNLTEADDLLQSVSKLPNLTDLVLLYCNLQDLDLSSDHMQGLIPEALGNMSSLEILDLGYNELEGPIPEALGNMTSLKILNLRGNNLEGGIPKSFGNLCKLRELDLSYNQITGGLPDLISNFSSLKRFYLSNNNLSGSTLTESIGLLLNLEVLDISSNHFYGVMITEAHFLKLSKLEYLDLSSNHLSINISPDWNPPFQLLSLNLGSCMLGPEFPKWIKSQRNLFFLDISHNRISDSIPKWFCNPSSSVSEVYLSFNNFSTTLLANLSIHLEGFSRIEMSSNSLKGPLPLFPANVTSIDLSNNSFYGSVSSLCAITGGFLDFLDLSYNQLSRELPYCLNRWPNLKILNMANNHFSGKNPSYIGTLFGLESFSLRNNSFVGEVPWSLGNCSSLQFVDLSCNQFSGMIPYWIGEELPKLAFLLLKSNHFDGSIPMQLCQWTNILLLDFSNNSLSGTIPWCIHHMTALTKKESSLVNLFPIPSLPRGNIVIRIYRGRASLMWKGTEFEIFDLGNRKIIDFSSNKLTGAIPTQIWSLIGLVQLNLSRNQLTGKIPPDMGHMQQLNSLDLSRNHLSGQLPHSMFQLASLGRLDLSYNNFSGRIPSGPQNYDATSFARNPALCGFLLNLPCPGDEKTSESSDHGDKHNEEDENGLWKGFIPGLEVGAAIGFVGVLAVVS